MDYLPRGASVGRFSILDRIGSGGMAVVYSAYDPELDRKVAIKLLHSRGGASSGGARGRLLREAQAMARVSHPNVIVVYDVGTFGDEVFLAEELVEGTTLWAWMREQRRPWREVTGVFVHAGRGLAAAHAAGLIHRDFKPPNVLMGTDGRVRVTDFGLARAAQEGDRPDATPIPRKVKVTADQAAHPHAETIDAPPTPVITPAPPSAPASSQKMTISAHDETVDALSATHASSPGPSSSGVLGTPLTEAGAVVGTPLYMSPEQHAGERTDARTDVWSFCVSLWEALYGAPPFLGGTVEELAAKVKAGKPTPPDDSDVPEWVRRVLLRGLSVARDERYASMDALLADLARDPAVARRRRAVVAAIVVLPVAAASLAFAFSNHRKEPARTQLCTGGDIELAGVWDDARRTEITAAFAKVATPHASESAAAVVKTLDQWRTDYTRMARDACEATRVRGTQSEELLDRRMACLADRRHEVGALVDLLAKADAKLVERSAEAVLHVADVSSCADADALANAVPKPPAAIAAKVDALREQLAHAKALEEAGHFADGLTLAHQIVTDARPLGFSPLLAEALVQSGMLEERAGNYPAAEEQLFEAFYAAEALRYDDVTARAAVELVNVVGFRRSRFDEAHRLTRHAEAILSRRGGSDQLLARLDNYDGAVYRAERKLDEAMTRQKSAVARFEKLYGPNNADAARARLNMANVYAQKGDLTSALGEFEHAEKVFVAAYGERHPSVALCHNNIGNVYYMTDRYDQALVEYRTARSLYEAALGPDHPDIAMARANTALILHGTGKLEEAKTEFLAAIAINEKAFGKDSPQVASDTINIAMLYNDMEKYADAVTALQRAIAINEKLLGADNPDVAFARTELAFALGHAGRANAAVGEAEKALAVRTAHSADVSPVEIARSEWALAFTLWKSKKDRPRALALVKSARERLAGEGDAGKHELAILDEWYAKDVGKKPN